MGDFNIRIKIDPSGAPSTIASVKAPLTDLEAMGPRVGASISKGFKEGGGAAEQLRDRVQQAVNPFDSLTQALKREQDMLAKIHGPARQYGEDLQTLDALLERNKISTEEYANEVTRLNKALGEKPRAEGPEAANPTERLEGGVGFVSGLIGGGVGAEVVELGKSIGELIEAGHRLEDEYINLKNATLGFKEAGVSTDSTVGDMRDLAEELHSKLPETINLYRKLSENADNLGLTHETVTEDVKAFGEAAIASGHTLDDAAGAVSRLSIAMQTGQLDARTLRSIIQTMPGIVKVWETAFHESYQQIVHDISEHKISVRDLMTATAQYGGVLKSTMEQHEKTNELTKEELIQGAKIFAQRHGVAFAEALYAQKLSETDLALAHNVDGTLRYVDALTVFDKLMKQVNHDVDEVKSQAMTGFIEKAGEFGVAVMADVHDLGEMSAGLGNLMQAMGAMDDKWGTVTNNMAQKAQHALGALGVGMKEAADRGATEEELRNLDNALASGARVTDAYEKRKALVEKLGGEERKYYDGIVAPMVEYERHLQMLNGFWARGTISAKEYADTLRKLGSSIGLAGQAGALGEGSSFDTQQRFLARHGGANPELDIGAPEGTTTAPAADAKAQQALTLYDKTRTAAEKYGDELKDINSLSAQGYINDQAKTRILADLETRYGKVYSQAEQYAKALQDLDARTKVGLVSTASYGRELDALKMKFNQGDAMTGFREGLRQIEADINPAKDAQKLLVDGFNGVRDSITSLVTTGTADFGKLVDSLLADAARMGEDKLLKDLLGLGAGGGVGGAAAAALGGAATGGDFDIPHAASGFAGVVRAPSGPDSHLAMFHVNPGEHVSIRTPEQMRSQGSSGPVNVPPTQVHVVMPDSRKQLPPPRSREMGEIVLVHIGERRSEIRAMLGIK